MSNYENEEDKLRARYIELERRHKELDKALETRYHNMTVNDEVRAMKTMKLYLKDEMFRINKRILQLGIS